MSSGRDFESVSVIGLGNFGGFLADGLCAQGRFKVMGCDPKETAVNEAVERVGVGKAALADVVILSIPLSSYEDVLEPLSKSITRGSLLVDLCSVKLRPEKLINRYLPEDLNLMMAHTLFDRHTFKSEYEANDLRIAVSGLKGIKARVMINELNEYGFELKYFEGSEDHDRWAALAEGIPMFHARMLANDYNEASEAARDLFYSNEPIKNLISMYNRAGAGELEAIFSNLFFIDRVNQLLDNSYNEPIDSRLIEMARDVILENLVEVTVKAHKDSLHKDIANSLASEIEPQD